MKLEKVLRKYNIQLFLGSVVLLLLALYMYSNYKSKTAETHVPLHPASVDGSSLLEDSGDLSEYASVNDVSNTELPQSSTPTINPSELLPKDTNKEWNELNPTSSTNVGDVNMLTPGPTHFMTMSKPLRNANLQLRSDPPVPQVPVSPWNNSTIGPDESRVTFEINCNN
jgi:hypothetical protein